jgi:hypothetical protein
MEGRLTRESTLPGPRSLILTVPSSPHYLAVVRNLVPLIGTLLMLLVDAVHFLGDGKEQRKIPHSIGFSGNVLNHSLLS